jgi:hypothetical protein
MAKLLITTQTYENYGDVAQPYWKPKGGSDYVVRNININSVKEIVESVRPQVECANEFYTEHMLGWEVVSDDYLTEFEKDQMEYEGKIRFPAKELVVSE